MNAREVVVYALQASIIVTVFGFGLKAKGDDILYVFHRPTLLIRSLLSMFVVMPVVAVALAQTFDFFHPVEVALVALSISPVPPLLPRRHDKAGGDASFGLGLMVTAAVLSLGIIPLALHLLSLFYDKSYATSPGSIVKIVFTAVIIPLLLGMLCGRFIPKVAARIASPAILIGKWLLPVAGVAILFVAHNVLEQLLGNGTVFAMMAFVAVALLAGHLLGGPSAGTREVLALSTACRHPGIAIALATANGGVTSDHQAPAAILLYLVLSILATVPYLKWQGRRIAAASAN
jgi:BASS family bile acid:Na+ symporter